MKRILIALTLFPFSVLSQDFIVRLEEGDTLYGKVKVNNNTGSIYLYKNDKDYSVYYPKELVGYKEGRKGFISLNAPFNPDSCYFSENIIDEFTKTRIKKYEVRFANSVSMYCMIKLQKHNERYSLRLTYNRGSIVSMVIGKDDPLMLKLANDSVYSLYPNDIYAAKTIFGSYSSRTEIEAVYLLPDFILKKLADIPLIKIRVYLADSFLEDIFESVPQKKLIKAAKCMIE